MVFCDFRNVFKLDGECSIIHMGADPLFLLESAVGSTVYGKEGGRTKAGTSISSVLSTCRNLPRTYIKKERRYRASFTVEATMVFMVVMICVSTLISHAYKVHDSVTGSMILEETLLLARRAQEETGEASEYRLQKAENYGKTIGNPRLWYGDYEIEAEMDEGKIIGKATAGDWEQEIEIDQFQPGVRLRRYETIRGIGEELANDGRGIQAGDEQKLYDNPTGDSRE